MLLLLQARAPLPPRSCNLRRCDPFSGREDNEEEGGRYSRCGGVACTASVEERRLDRVSAYWCLLQFPASAACCCFLLLLLAAAAAAAAAVLQVGPPAFTTNVLLVGPYKSAAAAGSVFFSNIRIHYLAIFRLRLRACRNAFDFDYLSAEILDTQNIMRRYSIGQNLYIY